MSAAGRGACQMCRGRGWKLVLVRRSAIAAGAVPERDALNRSRVTCLFCSGSGTVARQEVR